MKPFRLLIGYDGSVCADKALLDLSVAGLPGKVEAVLLTIADTWPAGQPTKTVQGDWVSELIRKSEDRHRQQVNDARLLAWQAAEALRVRYPDWTVRAEARADNPAWGIVRFADEWKPDLIVLGCQGHTALGRFLLGSVSQQVLVHSEGSVRVVHPATRSHRPPRLMIGYDGSTGSRKAITRVANRVWPKGTQVRVVSVIDEQIGILIATRMARKADVQNRQAREQFWLKQVVKPELNGLSKAGLHVVPVLLYGNPASLLLQEARRWKADCIFVSARGLTAIERFLLGSVSTRVAATAPCSVEIVR